MLRVASEEQSRNVYTDAVLCIPTSGAGEQSGCLRSSFVFYPGVYLVGVMIAPLTLSPRDKRSLELDEIGQQWPICFYHARGGLPFCVYTI